MEDSTHNTPPYPIIFKKNFALRHRLHSKMLCELPTGINYSRGTSGLISSYRNANYLTVWQYLVKTNNQAGLRPTCTGCVYDVVRLQLRILFSKLQSSPIVRSEEHTSELQSRPHLVCRLLLEKKNHN